MFRLRQTLLCIVAILVALTSHSAAHNVTLTGNLLFSAIDGGPLDHDGVQNGVFTINDGNLTIAGTVRCNDDAPAAPNAGACNIAFSVSGDLTLTGGSALVAENKKANGNGGNITLAVGGSLTLQGVSGATSGALVSSSRVSGGVMAEHAGSISFNVGGNVTLGPGSTVAANAPNASAGAITVHGGGAISLLGLITSGPSTKVKPTALTDRVLDGGDPNQRGNDITIACTAFADPGLTVGGTAIVVSQGDKPGAGTVTLSGCGLIVKGLLASASKKQGASHVSLLSGTAITIDGRDFGDPSQTLSRFGRVRADVVDDSALGSTVDVLANDGVEVFGPNPALTSLFSVTANQGTKPGGAAGGTVRVRSVAGTFTAAGNALQAGSRDPEDVGGTIDIQAKAAVTLDAASLSAAGDATSKKKGTGGAIAVQSFARGVSWIGGVGDVRPTGSAIAAAKRGSITLTACGPIAIAGSAFLANGSAVAPFPIQNAGVCPGIDPQLPPGVVLPTCLDPAPDVSTTSPANGAADVAAGTNIVITFSEPVNVTAGTFTIECPVGSTVPFTVSPPVPGAAATFTLDPTGGLPAGVVCTVNVVASTVTDVDVNDPPDGMVSDDAFTFTVHDDPPVATNDSARVLEDSGATSIDVLSNDSNPDGGPKTIDSTTDPPNGIVVITGSGTGLTYQPDANYCNSNTGTPDSFTYLLNGGSIGTVSVTVTCVEDNPAAVNDTATVNEGSVATAIDVLANDTDPDGGTRSIASITQPANGAVVIAGGGTGLTYAPNATYCNTPPGTTLDTFTYTLTPGGSVGTVTVTVTCVDDNPVAVNDAATVSEDSGATAIAVLANDTDVDGGPKSIASVTQPANGAVAITGGGTGLTYAPSPNYCNTPPGTTLDTFTYTLAPGGSVGMVTVTVTCVDDNPIAVNDAATVNEDSGSTTLSVLANDTDIDGGAKSVLSVTQPTHGAAAVVGGGTGVSYTPNADYCNNPPGTMLETFTYTLSPGGSTGTVTMTVTCVNDGPRIDLDADDDHGTTGANFAATYTKGDPAILIVDPLDATMIDVDGPGTVASLTVTISNLLDGTNETLSADVTGVPLVTAHYLPATGVLTLSGVDTLVNYETVLRTVRYVNTASTPNTTSRVIQFLANDGADDGNTVVSTVAVVIPDVAPTAVNDSATVTEDAGATAINVLANDTDPDAGPKSIDSTTQPSNGTAVITGGGTGVTYQPNANYCNTPPGTTLDTFTYTLTPGGSIGTVSVTVTCVDDAPVAVADAATVVEDSGANTINVLMNDTDIDGGAKTIASVTQPAHGTVVITNAGANLTYAPAANYCNAPPGTNLDTFTYTLTPGSSSTTVTVTVTCVDDAPVAVNDSTTVLEDAAATAVNVLANDTDVDGGPKSVASVTQPANSAVVITGGGTGLTYQPNANYCNSVSGPADTFTYTLAPGSSTGTVSVTVTWVDDPPVAVNDAATVKEDSSANAINVLGNDTDVDAGPKSVASVTQGAHGAVTITGGGTGVSYTPAANYCNSLNSTAADTFTYTLTPGSSQGTVTVTVTCVNDAPVAQTKTATAFTNMKVIGIQPGLLSGVTDADSGVSGCTPTFTVASITASTGGTVSNVNLANGSFDFDPNPGFTGTAVVNYTVSDTGCPGTATSAVANINITVSGTVIWFVNPSLGANGNGTLNSPFNNLASAAAVDAINHRIFIFTGTATTGIALNSGEWLIGQGATNSPVNTFDALMNISPPAGTIARPGIGGTRPIVQSTVTLETGTRVQGLNIQSTTSTGMNDPAGSITGAFVDQVAVTTTTGTGVLLSDVTGSGGTASSLTFTGLTSNGGTGASLTGTNTNTTFGFASLNISSGANNAFVATGGGTLAITGATNALASVGGVALTVSNTTIGAGGLTFQSIAANGGANGIVLNNTGSTGGLTVTGSGTTDGSGGTIQNISTRGANIQTVRSVTLTNMNFTSANNSVDGGLVGACETFIITGCNAAIYLRDISAGATLDNLNITGTMVENGITAINVANFKFDNGLIDNAGDGAAEGGIRAQNLSGTVTVNNSEIRFSETNSFDLVNTDVSANITINGSTFRDTQTVSSGGAVNTNGEGGFQFQSFSTAAGAPVTTINIVNSSFLRLRTQGIQVFSQDDSIINLDVTGSTIDAQTDIGTGIDINADDTATLNFNITNNPAIKSCGGAAVNITSFLDGHIEGRVNNNSHIEVLDSAGIPIRVLPQDRARQSSRSAATRSPT